MVLGLIAAFLATGGNSPLIVFYADKESGFFKQGGSVGDEIVDARGRRPTSPADFATIKREPPAIQLFTFRIRHKQKVITVRLSDGSDIQAGYEVGAELKRLIKRAVPPRESGVAAGALARDIGKALRGDLSEPVRDWLIYAESMAWFRMVGVPPGSFEVELQSYLGVLRTSRDDATRVRSTYLIANFCAPELKDVEECIVLARAHRWPLQCMRLLKVEESGRRLNGDLTAEGKAIHDRIDTAGSFGMQDELGHALLDYGHWLYRSQRFPEALEALDKSRPIIQSSDRGMLGYLDATKASVLWHLGRTQDAVAAYARAFDEWIGKDAITTPGPFRWSILPGGDTVEGYAAALQAVGNTRKALDICASLLKSAQKPNIVDVMQILAVQAKLKHCGGDSLGARKSSLEGIERSKTEDESFLYDKLLSDLYGTLGDAETALGDRDSAAKAYEKSRILVLRIKNTPSLSKQQLATMPPPPVASSRGTMAIPVNAEPSLPSFSNGKRYALLVATNDYRDPAWPHLANPSADAEALADELKESYAFETTLLKNPTKDQLWDATVKASQRQCSPADELLIFIAGHGAFDEQVLKDGKLVCADSKKDDRSYSTYFSYSDLSRMLDNANCRHVLLLMDVCFGGTFDRRVGEDQQPMRGSDPYAEVDEETMLRRAVKWPTRKVLTSGAKEVVSDGRPGEHSPFVRKLLEILRTQGLRQRVLTFEDLVAPLQRLQTRAIYGDFGRSEPGSGFFFVRAKREEGASLKVAPALDWIRRPWGCSTSRGQMDPLGDSTGRLTRLP